MKKGIKYYRDGVEIDKEDALQSGALRDGVSMSVPTTMRDSLSPLQRAVAADADRPARVTDGFGNPAGHRPGYAFTNDQSAVDTKRQAYADYDNDLTNAWRNEPDDDDFGSGDLGNGREGDVCTCRGAEYRLDFGAPGHIRNGICVPDRPRKPQKRRDAVNAKELVRDHRQRMQECYSAYDREIVEMWRSK